MSSQSSALGAAAVQIGSQKIEKGQPGCGLAFFAHEYF